MRITSIEDLWARKTHAIRNSASHKPLGRYLWTHRRYSGAILHEQL